MGLGRSGVRFESGFGYVGRRSNGTADAGSRCKGKSIRNGISGRDCNVVHPYGEADSLIKGDSGVRPGFLMGLFGALGGWMTVNQERQAVFQRIIIAVLGGGLLGFLLGLAL